LEEVAQAVSLSPEPSVPAGWYPDPAGSFQQRWWNGIAWTNDFAQYRPTFPKIDQPGAQPFGGAAFTSQLISSKPDDTPLE
jgi:hypothetical protein